MDYISIVHHMDYIGICYSVRLIDAQNWIVN